MLDRAHSAGHLCARNVRFPRRVLPLWVERGSPSPTGVKWGFNMRHRPPAWPLTAAFHTKFQIPKKMNNALRPSLRAHCLTLLPIFILLTGVLPITASGKEPKRFTVLDSSAWANSESTVGWLSNDEVVFRGSENISPKPGDETISIWKIGKGVTIYKRHVSSLCFHYTNMVYVFKNEYAKEEVYAGLFGQEKKTTFRDLKLNGTTCESGAEYKDESRNILPLLPEHGAIDRGPRIGPDSLKNDPLVFLKKGESKDIALPLLRREIFGISYYPFMQAYLVESDYFDPLTQINRSPWPADLPRPLWWLTPEGNVTKFMIALPWNRSASFFPTTVGIVVAGHDQRRPPSQWPRDIGLFLIKPSGAVETLLEGDIRRVAVSPNGCAVAFIHREAPLKPGGSPKLKVVKFCG